MVNVQVFFAYPLPSLPPSLSRSFSEAKQGGRSLFPGYIFSPLGENKKGGFNFQEQGIVITIN